MLRFCRHETRVKQLLELGPLAPPIVNIREAAGLSRSQFAAVLKVRTSSIYQWETGRTYSGALNHLAWLVYLAYLQPDPVNGWIRAAAGLPPNGRLDAEVVQKVVQPLPDTVQVAGYQRKRRKPRLIKTQLP